MSVHYKFKSALEYDTVTFDGLHISVKDLKKAIIHQKRIGKNTDFDLQVTNAQTKEVYNDENALIPKNTSLVIARVPMVAQSKSKPWEGYGTPQGAVATAGTVRPEEGALSKAVDLTQLDASEDDKIRAMMTQSTLDYDPSNYMKIRGANQVGVVPTHYRCFKCHQPGHWIKDCPLGHGQEPMEIKKSTGIPRSFMVPVEGPMVPGAMMTPTGQYAVPVLDHQAYNEGPKSAPAQEEKPEIPEDLLCTICKDLLTDAVMIPCCGNSFCDECIRTVLLESEDHECPDCHEKEISPGTLIPNRFLRNSVSNFKNETGYHKRQQYRNAVSQNMKQEAENADAKPVVPQEPVVHPAESTTETRAESPVKEQIKPDSQTADEPERNTDSQKPIISEADSTETTKSSTAVKEEVQEKTSSRSSPPPEGPPGVESPIPEKPPASEESPPGVELSPKEPPPKAKQGQAITSVGSAVNHHRVSYHVSQNNSGRHNREESSSRHYRNSVQNYSEDNSRSEERPGTPTVDEPGMGPPGYTEPSVPYSDAPPPGLHPTATALPPSQHMHPPPQIQGPPPPQPMPQPPPYIPPASTHQPPPGVYPPPNAPPPGGFRMPPPGHPDFNRVTGTAYGDAHQLPRVLLVTSLDPTVPPPNVAPPGSFPPRPIFDPTRPPVPFDPHRPPLHGAPPPGYPPYPPGPRPTGRPYPPPRHMQPPPPGMNHRPPPHQPPNVIDDPLEAFNRMLREKDERDRRARQRRVSRSRSYSRSRSSSRSFSRSPRSRSRTPPPRNRHRSRTRSPVRRRTRSRSRSFSISRSRSFSRSPSFRGSPGRDYSPRRRPPSRYRSPVNRGSPPRYRYKEPRPPLDRDRDRLHADRPHSDRPHHDHGTHHSSHSRPHDRGEAREPRDNREYFDSTAEHFDGYEGYDRANRTGQRPPLLRNPRYGGPPRKEYGGQHGQEGYYPPQEMPYANRYNRGPTYPPPLMSVKTLPPQDRPEAPHRKYDDVAPPGIEQPPVPGFENQRYDGRYPFDRPRDDGPPGVDRFQKSPYSERDELRENDRPARPENNREFRDRPRDASGENRFERKYSPSPDRKHRSPSTRRSSRSPEKSRRRRHDTPDRDKSKTESDRDKKDKKRDTSEDEKGRKNKDKKKKKEKREAERKKKKERKEKKEQEKLKKAEEKEKKAKEESTKDDNKKEEVTPVVKPEKEAKEPVPEVKEAKLEEPKPKEVKEPEKPKVDLYDDILTEGIDNTVVENYGKIDQHKERTPSPVPEKQPISQTPEGQPKTEEEPEEKDTSFDGIELQANEAELKTDFIDVKSKSNEMLAPLPEPSKWEIDEDTPVTPEKPGDPKSELKQVFERPGKVVTSEVIKRAENAIFAKAINAIRPIEIKKISLDRAKLYSGEKHSPQESGIKESVKNFQITIPGWNLDDIPPPGTEPIKLKPKSPPPNRLSVKERLGCKVEELDKITKEEKPFERNRSRTLSPLSRRMEEAGRNVSLGERKVEIDDRIDRRREEYNKRPDDRFKHDRRFDSRQDDRERRPHRSDRSRSRDRRDRRPERKDYRRDDRKDDRRDDRKTERSHSRHRSDRRHDHRDDRHRDDKQDKERPSKSRRSKSRSESRDRKDKRKKSKDKKHKKEKEKDKKETKKHKKEDGEERKSSEVTVESKIISEKKDDSKEKSEKAKPVEDRRKPTLDEANFEPDYEETESEKEEKKAESRKRERSKSPEKEKKPIPEVKKRKIEEPEKKPKDSSSSDSSDSSSDEKHKKKHKKHKKKKSRRDTSSSSDSSDSDSSVDKKKKRHKSSKKLKKKKKSKHK